MNFFFIMIITLLVTACSLNNQTFICGDHECVNDKEMKEFFSKNLYIEVITPNKKNNDYVDLVQLNTGINEKKLENEVFNDKEIKKLNKQEIKQQISDRKKNEKLKKINEKALKNELKKEKKIAKLNKRKSKLKKENIYKKPINKKRNITKKELAVRKIIKLSDYCIDLKNCDIDQISEQIIKNSKSKNYPKIN